MATTVTVTVALDAASSSMSELNTSLATPSMSPWEVDREYPGVTFLVYGILGGFIIGFVYLIARDGWNKYHGYNPLEDPEVQGPSPFPTTAASGAGDRNGKKPHGLPKIDLSQSKLVGDAASTHKGSTTSLSSGNAKPCSEPSSEPTTELASTSTGVGEKPDAKASAFRSMIPPLDRAEDSSSQERNPNSDYGIRRVSDTAGCNNYAGQKEDQTWW